MQISISALWFAVAALLAGHFFLISARADSYRVAHVSDGFTGFSYALINNAGVVMFVASRRDSSGKQYSGVYKSRGTGFMTVIEAPDLGPTPPGQIRLAGHDLIWINNKGLMAIAGRGAGQTFPSVYVGGGTIGPAQEVGTLLFNGLLPTITDDNLVAFGPIIRPYPPDLNFPPTLGDCSSCGGFGRLSSHRYLLFENNANISIVTIGPVTLEGNTFPQLMPILTNPVVSISEQARTAGVRAMLNDQGTVAYFDFPSAGVTGIYRKPGVPFVEQRTGSEFTFNGAPPFALNNQGQVAFHAHSRTLGKFGFFRGPNALTDKIVVEGDIVAGSQLVFLRTPEQLAFPNRWFNDGGQIVFQATDNAGVGLWVTDGVASPPPIASAQVRWVPNNTPPSGSFAVAANWQPINGDTPRVPQKNTVLNDTAVFDWATAYTVDIGPQHIARLIVKDGNVIFQNGNLIADALSDGLTFLSPSVVIDNAQLTLAASMVLTANHAIIGESAASRVNVGLGLDGFWINYGSLRVGGSGEGILNISIGAVNSGEARIGTGAGGGRATVDGSGASWTTGAIAIGAGGKGELTITNRGTVSSYAAVIGQEPGSGNKVIVHGGNSAGRSKWEYGPLVVGARGTGRLEVRDGGFVSVGNIKVGTHSAASGEIIVSGVGANEVRAIIETGELFVGKGGPGTLTIEDGGLVEVGGGDMYSGELGGIGDITVRGVHGTNASALRVENSPGSGSWFMGPGLTIVETSGRIEVANFLAMSSASLSTPAQMKIIGANARVIAKSLQVGNTGGNPGGALVTLVGGTMEAIDLFVNQNGRIEGFGTLAVPLSGRVTNDNGTISPGLSPGVLTLQGIYEQGANGRLLIELGGTNAVDYDQFIVTSNATLNGNLTLRCLDGFAPRAGDSFHFLKVGGELTGEFSNVGLEHLAPGFQFQFVTNGGQLGITALNDGVFSTALPGQVQVAMTNVGGINYAKYTITTSNSCDQVALSGPLSRTNNVFSQVFQGTTFVKPGCVSGPTTTSGILVLGQLSPGDYSFRIMSHTQVVGTVAFTVSTNVAKTLSAPIRLADGSLQFGIAGLPPFIGTIEASTDLQTWNPLNQGVLPFTYIDPDAAIYPQRFYRAIIGE